jgi:hypothetical protein
MSHNVKAKNLKFRDNLQGYKPKYFKNGFCVSWNLAKSIFMIEYCDSSPKIEYYKTIKEVNFRLNNFNN